MFSENVSFSSASLLKGQFLECHLLKTSFCQNGSTHKVGVLVSFSLHDTRCQSKWKYVDIYYDSIGGREICPPKMNQDKKNSEKQTSRELHGNTDRGDPAVTAGIPR